jgi:acetyltransferase-like isoleucine patch superfamily enzyme
MFKRIVNYILFKIKNPTVKISFSVKCSRNLMCGRNVLIGSYSSISRNTIIGNNIIIGSNTTLRSIKIGDNSFMESCVKVVGTEQGKITIGEQCYIGIFNVLDNSDDINIGNYVHIAGPSTGLWTHSSAMMCINNIALNDPDRYRYRPTAPIVIEDNVYIGGNCTIYPGVRIGHHSIVAPNSAVNKDVPPYKMVGGVPAKVIKEINTTANG